MQHLSDWTLSSISPAVMALLSCGVGLLLSPKSMHTLRQAGLSTYKHDSDLRLNSHRYLQIRF